MTPAKVRRPTWRVALGWVALALLFAYAVTIHQGLGPIPRGQAPRWWHPSGFLVATEMVGNWEDSPAVGITLVSLPAAMLAGGVLLGTSSAVAGMLALSTVAAVALFGFYGLSTSFPWPFFHWRGSLVMAATGLAVGAALTAPLLAASWLRRRWPLRLLLYLPIFFGIAAMIRNVTGTDERLAFNFSPWPAISIFGLEIGAYSVAGLWFGIAVGISGLALGRSRRDLAAAGVVAGLLIPVAWFWFRFASSGVLVLCAVFAAAVLGLALASIGPAAGRRDRLLRRAFHMVLGASLVSFPLLSGRALATGDYSVNRYVRAEKLNTALYRYYVTHLEYPDSLSVLVQEQYLDSIPTPRVGFDLPYHLGWMDPIAFHYQSLGSSYVLEFISTEWIQCSYNPPWYDEEEEEEEEDLESEESWSCPETRPELW
ncbi:MAG: hypothetical protein V3T33_01520 [Myxococcota bacterium]